MKPRLLAALFLTIAAAQVRADLPIVDSTCNGSFQIVELAYGTYQIAGVTRTYPVGVLYPFQTSIVLTPQAPVSTSFVLATCDAPPGPQTRCRAISGSQGESLSLGVTDDAAGPSSNTYWIVVSSTTSCGSFRLDGYGPIG